MRWVSYLVNEGEASVESLRNGFDDRSVSILAVMALWKGGPHVSQSVRCRIIVAKDVERLIEFRHETLGFVKQATAID